MFIYPEPNHIIDISLLELIDEMSKDNQNDDIEKKLLSFNTEIMYENLPKQMFEICNKIKNLNDYPATYYRLSSETFPFIRIYCYKINKNYQPNVSIYDRPKMIENHIIGINRIYQCLRSYEIGKSHLLYDEMLKINYPKYSGNPMCYDVKF